MFSLSPSQQRFGVIRFGVKSLVGQTSPSPDGGKGGGTIDCRVADPLRKGALSS